MSVYVTNNYFRKKEEAGQIGPSRKRRMQDDGQPEEDSIVQDQDTEMTVPVDRPSRRKIRRFKRKAYMARSDRTVMMTMPEPPVVTPGLACYFEAQFIHRGQYTRDELLQAVVSRIHPIALEPLDVRSNGYEMRFFVDNERTANALLATSFKVRMTDDWKVQFTVQPFIPTVVVDRSLKEHIKSVMSSQYDATNQHLNLARFHANEEFVRENLFVPLNNPNVLLTVFQIIAENTPNLRSLDLSNNMICAFKHFDMMARIMPELKCLDLSRNKIRDVQCMNCLRGLNLDLLLLDENPLWRNIGDQTTCVCEVRKIFKSLRQLDEIVLPAPLDFGLDDPMRPVPKYYHSFFPHSEGQEFTRLFLGEFYSMYDDPQRRDTLERAYADNAQFSMTAHSTSREVNLSEYIRKSRNMKKVIDYPDQCRLLHTGKNEIVRFLNTLPRTQHDYSSFSVDVPVFNKSGLICLNVSGVFRDAEIVGNADKSTCIKAFSRAFVLVPASSGFHITNDMLSITNATPGQISKAFESVPMTAPETSSTPMSLVEEVDRMDEMDDPFQEYSNHKRERVIALATQTGMNLMWAEKCLIELDWNFDGAMRAFMRFNSAGQIPPEAFHK